MTTPTEIHPDPFSTPRHEHPPPPFSSRPTTVPSTPYLPPADMVLADSYPAINPSNNSHSVPGNANSLTNAPSAALDAHLWSQRLSQSLSQMANEIATASQALNSMPPPAAQQPSHIVYDPSLDSSTASLEVDVAALTTKLEAMEVKQDALIREVEGLKDLILSSHPTTNGATTNGAANGHANGGENGVSENGTPPGVSAYQELEKKVTDALDSIKIEQGRLYARLLNARLSHQKQTIQPILMTNGKVPPNYPVTKGEFEKLTKERYEALLKSYGLPVKGDTDAKREAVRQFLGLPPIVM
ncbi:hypothetical protein JAAARDRAFT_195391 [Jaapia argillacea MUCL 33604]|uniref:DUF7722 domain-containing protein n=1 Tax=Jaapia argillacea MUCL 33604 TaxID=933084 RepID=A0A067Q0S3_9AGAM|nr:hypothetical protein JAAARDRAFT_195391 [Jaapia argillacea MUCL 33604]